MNLFRDWTDWRRSHLIPLDETTEIDREKRFVPRWLWIGRFFPALPSFSEEENDDHYYFDEHYDNYEENLYEDVEAENQDDDMYHDEDYI